MKERNRRKLKKKTVKLKKKATLSLPLICVT